jgi:pimeloyl-ACP methyl ester carboxylesterase
MKYIFNSFFLLISICAFGQSDLVVTSASIQTTNISVGDYLTLKFRVKNIGNVTAPSSHTKIYISQISYVDSYSILLGEISTESLVAYTETQDIKFNRPLPYNVFGGKNYIIISVNNENEVFELNYNNNSYSIPSTINVNNVIGGQQNLPYPIIFIHGLGSNSSTWDPFIVDIQNKFGFSYGGNMNFCLNQDDNLKTSSRASDYHDYTNLSLLGKTDLYTVNFNVGTNGNDPSLTNPDVESNQSAIVKQGWAVQDAVKHVLEVTGRDKVILVGHSMGGLASREYLQNSVNWQSDGKHHVAKLLTIGTPHGGSNASSWGLVGIFTGLDEKSEAVRDLRITYSTSLNKGVYLSGGQELKSVMDRTGFLTPPYHNVDVNCDGIDGDGTLIKGLNEKYLPTDLNYSCIIGTGALTKCNDATGFYGDNVVCEFSSNLKTYYPNDLIDTFISRQPVLNNSIWHSKLPEQTEFIIKGIDESNEYLQSYKIETNKIYFGNLSDQSKGSTNNKQDHDAYKFSISQNGIISPKIYNIPISQCYIKLLDSSQQIIYTDSSNGKGYLEFNKSLKAGNYFFKIYGYPTSNSWLSQYGFQVNYTAAPPVFNPFADTIKVCGDTLVLDATSFYTAYNWNTGATTSSLNITHSGFYKVTVTDAFGQTASDSTYVAILNANIPEQDTTICKSASISLSVKTPFSKNFTFLAKYLDSSYYVSNQQFSWFEGRDYSVSLGGHLATFNTIKEDTLVSNKIKRLTTINSYPLSLAKNSGECYIGLLQNKSSINYSEPAGGWQWITGEPLTYSNWSPTEPNNNSVMSEYATTNWNNSAKWNDIGPGTITGTNGIHQFVVELYKSPYSILWSTGDTTENITVSPTKTTTYYVTVRDRLTSCMDSVTVTVSGISAFKPLQDTTKACGDSTILNAGSGFDTYSWSNGAKTQSIAVKQMGKYLVTVTNAAGCSATDSSFVSIINANIFNNDTAICKGSSIKISLDSSKLTNYAVGASGPSGGLIIYDKGVTSAGWRYLECASSDASGGIGWWNGTLITTGASSTAIGSGFQNTSTVITSQGAGNYAAVAAKNYTQSGYTDWFLPSKDELNLIYQNLKSKGLGNLNSDFYWSSSEFNVNAAYRQVFNNQGLMDAGWKNFTNGAVRSVRYFASDNLKVKWSTGDTTNFITVSPTKTTKYYCTISNGISSCIDSVTVTIGLPDTTLAVLDPQQTCSNAGSVRIRAGVASSYKWLKDGVVIPNASVNSYNALQTGSYRVVVFNSIGCSDTSRSVAVIINPLPPTPIITLGGSTKFCLGGNVILSSSAANGNQWYRDGVLINGATNSTYSATLSGVYIDTLVNSNGCKSASIITTVIVNTNPTKPSIIWNGSILSTNSSATSFQWSVNNVPLFGATASTYKPLTIGFYKIQITNPDGCNNISDSFNLVVTALSNPASTTVKNLASVFPNPASPVLLVKFREVPSTTMEINLITNEGKSIRVLKTKEKLTSVPIENVPAGNYFIRITGNNFNQIEKVIISK